MYSDNFQIKTIEKANTIIRLRQSGMKDREIGDLLGMHRKSVSLLVRSIQKYPNLIKPELRKWLEVRKHD